MAVDRYRQSLVAAPRRLIAAAGRQRRHGRLNNDIGTRRQIRNRRRHFERALLTGGEDERLPVSDDSQSWLRNNLNFECVAAVVEPHLVRMSRQIGKRNFQTWRKTLVVWREFDLQLPS